MHFVRYFIDVSNAVSVVNQFSNVNFYLVRIINHELQFGEVFAFKF